MRADAIAFIRDEARRRGMIMSDFSEAMGERRKYLANCLCHGGGSIHMAVLRLQDKLEFPPGMVEWAEKRAKFRRSNQGAAPKTYEITPAVYNYPSPYPQPRA